MSTTGWVGVDLDGTLAEYHGWPKDGSIGAPVPTMVDRVKRWLAEGKDVRIVTARVAWNSDVMYVPEAPSIEAEAIRLERLEQRKAIERWCLTHLGQALEVTCCKDFQMIELWDDRCVQVLTNLGRTAIDFATNGRLERLAVRVAPGENLLVVEGEEILSEIVSVMSAEEDPLDAPDPEAIAADRAADDDTHDVDHAIRLLDDLLSRDDARFAATFLEGVKETIEKTGRVSDAQWRGIRNVESAAERSADRRYDDASGWRRRYEGR